jgi:ABC-type phosphate transport system substrate-binding protein
MGRTKVVALATLVAGSTAVLAEERASTPAYRVIVHPSNPASGVDRKFLADAFLKKSTRWPNQELIRPVDLDAATSTRRTFTREVLARSVSAVRNYWQQSIFSGRDVPPPELDSDEEVVRYVLRHSGAVGYVSGSANVSGAKILAVK